jgi:hypothetical protein
MSLFYETEYSRCESKEHSTENFPHHTGIFLMRKNSNTAEVKIMQLFSAHIEKMTAQSEF